MKDEPNQVQALLLEWLVTFGMRTDVSWQECHEIGMTIRMNFGDMARRGYILGTTNPRNHGGQWRYHLSNEGLEYINGKR